MEVSAREGGVVSLFQNIRDAEPHAPPVEAAGSTPASSLSIEVFKITY